MTVKRLANKSVRRAGVLVLFAAMLALLGAAAPAVVRRHKCAGSAGAPGGPCARLPAAPGPRGGSRARRCGPTNSAAQLDAAKQSLDQIESFLEDNSLTDAVLANQHDAIEPVKKQIQAAIADLTPKLAAIKARLDQLGSAPDPKANPPPAPEDPDVAQDRAEQAKLYAATDDLLKRANLLAGARRSIGRTDRRAPPRPFRQRRLPAGNEHCRPRPVA